MRMEERRARKQRMAGERMAKREAKAERRDRREAKAGRQSMKGKGGATRGPASRPNPTKAGGGVNKIGGRPMPSPFTGNQPGGGWTDNQPGGGGGVNKIGGRPMPSPFPGNRPGSGGPVDRPAVESPGGGRGPYRPQPSPMPGGNDVKDIRGTDNPLNRKKRGGGDGKVYMGGPVSGGGNNVGIPGRSGGWGGPDGRPPGGRPMPGRTDDDYRYRPQPSPGGGGVNKIGGRPMPSPFPGNRPGGGGPGGRPMPGRTDDDYRYRPQPSPGGRGGNNVKPDFSLNMQDIMKKYNSSRG